LRKISISELSLIIPYTMCKVLFKYRQKIQGRNIIISEISNKYLSGLNAVTALSTEGHLDRSSVDATREQTLTELAETRRGSGLVTSSVGTLLAQFTGPEDLPEDTGAGPGKVVERDFVDGLAPDGDLAADDELVLFGGEVGRGAVRVDELPALGGRAPVVVGCVRGVAVAGLEGYPLATATVEVL
jgi:hypothetical protein